MLCDRRNLIHRERRNCELSRRILRKNIAHIFRNGIDGQRSIVPNYSVWQQRNRFAFARALSAVPFGEACPLVSSSASSNLRPLDLGEAIAPALWSSPSRAVDRTMLAQNSGGWMPENLFHGAFLRNKIKIPYTLLP